LGGQFAPAPGGQFAPARGGQFSPASGGQFDRFLHLYTLNTANQISEESVKSANKLTLN